MSDVSSGGSLKRSRNARPAAIDKVGTALVLPADEVLYRQGETADSLYFLDSGAVTIGVGAAVGEQAIIAVHGPGTFFGAWSFANEVYNSTATALLPSAVVRVSKSAVQSLVRTDPTFARQFAMHMMRRGARLEEDQIDRATNPLKKRLARTLLILAGLDAQSDDGRVLERMTDATLARMLAADPRCIRELLQEFRQAGQLGPDDPLTVYSSLVNVLLPAHLAGAHGPLDVLRR
jgi:CRP/FNR family transcriptional regulator, cyclic AMP receptor protein